MDLRLALYQLAARHQLDPNAMAELERAAGLGREPDQLAARLSRAVAVLAAALGGLGIILWVAANWDSFGRPGRFALLQAVVVVMGAAALWRPAARAPLGLLAMLGIGGLFAYFGQTYQTGADPWQLFALWAVLALPLCLAARSDVLWAPWALVVVTAISLWVYAHTGHRWDVQPDDLPAHLIGWGAAALVVAGLNPSLSRYSGAGEWSLRTALTLAVVMITASSLSGLFTRDVAGHYGVGLAVLAGAGAAVAMPRWFDVYGLSALALGLNTLVVAGLARVLFDNGGGAIAKLLLLGLVAAALLAGTVSLVLRLARGQAAEAIRS